jgi:hypothetical protein
MTNKSCYRAPAASSNQKAKSYLSVMLVMQKVMTDMTNMMAAPASKKKNARALCCTCVVMTT